MHELVLFIAELHDMVQPYCYALKWQLLISSGANMELLQPQNTFNANTGIWALFWKNVKSSFHGTLSIYLRVDLRHFAAAWLFYPSGTQWDHPVPLELQTYPTTTKEKII